MKIDLREEFLEVCKSIRVGKTLIPKIKTSGGIDKTKYSLNKVPTLKIINPIDSCVENTKMVKRIMPNEYDINPLCPPESSIMQTNALGIGCELRKGNKVTFFDFYKIVDGHTVEYYINFSIN